MARSQAGSISCLSSALEYDLYTIARTSSCAADTMPVIESYPLESVTN